MTDVPHALISGAGIAGPALALALEHSGWRTTVVERSTEHRAMGQNVDIRGQAHTVVRRLGIEDDIRAAGTGEVGMRFVDQDGASVAEFPSGAGQPAQGPTAELEILRGDLSDILYERTRSGTEYLFGRTINDVADRGNHIGVVLDDGTELTASVLVIAEGLRSTTRKFVEDAKVDELGMYYAYCTVPRRVGDDQWWSWQHARLSRAVHLRPDARGNTNAVLTLGSDVRGLQDLDRADQIAILRDTFADVGGSTPRILAALSDTPMHFGAAGRLRSSTLVNGRVALLGDSGQCNSTFGGAGTSMALLGGYLLANELRGAAGDHRAGLKWYERLVRTHTDAVPPTSRTLLRLANPRTRFGIETLHASARVLASRPARVVRELVNRSRFELPAKDANRLPDYGFEHAGA